MNIIEGLGSGKMKDGAGVPSPSSGYRRYFYLLWNFFWTFVGLNLLFVLFSLPVITMPAAVAAVNRVCLKLIREGNVFLWDDFIKEFKSCFLKSLLPGLMFAGMFFISYYLLSLGLTNSMNIFGILFSAAGLAVLLLTVAWSGYFFVLCAMFNISSGVLLKNAFKLMMLGGIQTVLILLSAAALAFIAAALYPVSLFLLILCLPVLFQYTVSFLCAAVISAYTSSV